MSDTLHSNDLNNKGTKTLLGREMIIRHRWECHSDQVKGHHDWNTLKCVTSCHFSDYSFSVCDNINGWLMYALAYSPPSTTYVNCPIVLSHAQKTHF